MLGKYSDTLNRVESLTLTKSQGLSYHRKCYQTICHQQHLERAEKKRKDEIQLTAAKKKRGRLSEDAHSSSKTRKTFDQELCVFCQNDEKIDVHEVKTTDIGRKFLQIKEKTRNVGTRARLAFLTDEKDAFALNFKYHRNCLRRETRAIETAQCSSSDIYLEDDCIGKAICDVEIANIVSSMIAVDNGLDNGQQFPTADMNSIHEKYLSRLQEKGANFDSKTTYKPHIKMFY